MKSETGNDGRKLGLMAAGGAFGALAASSCCVLPLLLVAAGVTGSWIGSLTRLAPYQPLFLAVAAVCIGLGFWTSYGRRRMACDGAQCGTVASRRAARAVLWSATVMVGVAASVDWWANLIP
jgi:mercuric ion transport protein